MFLTIVLWALGAFFLIWMALAVMSVPDAIGRAVERGLRKTEFGRSRSLRDYFAKRRQREPRGS